jgi:2-dehydropantoate 2-reductase
VHGLEQNGVIVPSTTPSKKNHDVAFIARRAHLQAMFESSLRVQSPDGDFVIESPNATDDPGQIDPVDLILFSVKTYDAPEAIEMMQPMVGPGTVVLPVLNGVEHIEQLGNRIGRSHVLGGMARSRAVEKSLACPRLSTISSTLA